MAEQTPTNAPQSQQPLFEMQLLRDSVANVMYEYIVRILLGTSVGICSTIIR